MSNTEDFLVVLRQSIITIPQTSNLSWLTLFYALPKELVEKRPEYLLLPRNINVLVASEKATSLIEDDAFLELAWDCYAWSVWQAFQVPLKDGTYRDIPGDWRNYSGSFPLWRLSYAILPYIRQKFETAMEWSFQRLFMMPDDVEVPWLSYQHFGNLIFNLTDMIVSEQNWQPMIDDIWRNRQEDDYTGYSVFRNDFMKAWQHTRTVRETITIDDLESWSVEELGAHAVQNDPAEEAVNTIDFEEFKDTLTERDKKILELRVQGKTLEEIAPLVGYQSESSVYKRLKQITEKYKEIEIEP